MYPVQDAAIIAPDGEPQISDPEMVALPVDENKVQQVGASGRSDTTRPNETREKEEPTYSENQTDRLMYIRFMKTMRGYLRKTINVQRDAKLTSSAGATTRNAATRRPAKNVRPLNVERIRVVHPNLKALLLARLLNCHNTADS